MYKKPDYYYRQHGNFREKYKLRRNRDVVEHFCENCILVEEGCSDVVEYFLLLGGLFYSAENIVRGGMVVALLMLLDFPRGQDPFRPPLDGKLLYYIVSVPLLAQTRRLMNELINGIKRINE